jgi:hypothetical protein
MMSCCDVNAATKCNAVELVAHTTAGGGVKSACKMLNCATSDDEEGAREESTTR